MKIKIRTNFRKILTHPLVLHLLVFVLFSFLIIGADYSKNYRILKALPSVLGQTVFEKVENKPEVSGKVQGISKADIKAVKKAVIAASPSPNSNPNPSPKDSTQNSPSDSSRSTLCKGVEDDWKMIPDPSHEGLYVICNTTSEKMTSVGELNNAQNNYRVEHGLNSLNINSKLCEIAASRAVDVSKGFSHDGFKSAVEGSGLEKTSYGENIASGPLSGVHFVEWSWDKSSGHKANMLGDWTDGCGGVSGKYAVFLFAK